MMQFALKRKEKNNLNHKENLIKEKREYIWMQGKKEVEKEK